MIIIKKKMRFLQKNKSVYFFLSLRKVYNYKNIGKVGVIL